MSDKKCIIILSEKSSGSSACQTLLTQFAQVQHVAQTRHFENETLYWTKAASILDKPQINMVDSEVPIEREKAKVDLVTLLQDNLNQDLSSQVVDKAFIMAGWHQLCQQYAPIFLEKSPHHLCQWSTLELIVESIQEIKDVDFLLLGLVRNPMDTVYSNFKRWRSRPEEVQKQWLIAYQNLLKLKQVVGQKLVIIRYEDMVSSLEYLAPVFEFCGVQTDLADKSYLHQRSLSKWKNDHAFGFVLADEVVTLAEQYGYQKDELTHKSTFWWPIYREGVRAVYMMSKPIRKVVRGWLGK